MKPSNKLEVAYSVYGWSGQSIMRAYYRYFGYKMLIDKLYDAIGKKMSDEERAEIKQLAELIKAHRIKPQFIDNLVKFLNSPECDLIRKHTQDITQYLAL